MYCIAECCYAECHSAKLELAAFSERPGQAYRQQKTHSKIAHVNEPLYLKIYKVDTDSRDVFVWKDPGHFVSEPVFVAKPAAEREDVGVVLFTLLSAAKHNSVQVPAWTNLS